tara:strand:+ start:1813 stop:2205 length:393 start_codon:yes stop_codon:yes gene_type:complete
MNLKSRDLLFGFFLIILILTTNIGLLTIEKASASESKETDLINKISKDYTKKFCNSIGFGLSKESAMKFSIAENKKVFEKRKGIEDIDKIKLSKKIAVSVIDGCGYQLDLNDDKDIEEYANYYLSLEQDK